MLAQLRHAITGCARAVIPKVWVATQTRVKMGRAEVIQTRVVYFQHYHCLYVSVA